MVAEVCPLRFEHRRDHGRQQQCIGARTNCQPLVGRLGSATATWVNHDDASTACAKCFESPRPVGRCGQAAVAGIRVGAQHQQILATIKIGNRHRDGGAKHKASRHLFGNLVNARSTKSLATTNRSEQHAIERHRRQVVRTRVAEIGANRLAAVVGDDLGEPTFDVFPRFFPRHFNMFAIAPHEWLTQPIGVFVQLLQSRAFRADVALGEHIVHVAANPHDGGVTHRNLQPATCFAKRTRAHHNAVGHCITSFCAAWQPCAFRAR